MGWRLVAHRADSTVGPGCGRGSATRTGTDTGSGAAPLPSPDSTPALSIHAKIVLGSADGESNSSIAARLDRTRSTVGRWRTRFVAQRIQGLHDGLPACAPRTIHDERVADLIDRTPHKRPEGGATQWGVCSIAAETGISSTSVHRHFGRAFGCQTCDNHPAVSGHNTPSMRSRKKP
jgi:transposase